MHSVPWFEDEERVVNYGGGSGKQQVDDNLCFVDVAQLSKIGRAGAAFHVLTCYAPSFI